MPKGYKMPKDKVTTEIDRFIRMEANGCTRAEKLHELFGIDSLDDPRLHAADLKMSRWRKHPLYDSVWKDEIAKQDYSDFVTARQKLRKAMNNEKDGWLSMQASVNVLNASSKRIYGAEENTVTVHIEGMPDIGSPDD
jgi:hypothetical protein